MMKRILLALALLASSPAWATERNPDPGFDTPVSWSAMGKTPQPTVSASKAHFTGATSMTMLMISAPGVKYNHKYRVSWTVSSRTAGSVQVVLAKPMMGVATGVNIPAVSLAGLAPISDNFTTSGGLDTVSPTTPPGSPTLSAFRVMWSAGPITPNDPEVYSGQQGVSHNHQFICNIWVATHPGAVYATQRANGTTTCGNILDTRYPLNRSAYWFPALVDVRDGYAIQPHGNLYYKRYWLGAPECHTALGAGSCIEVPHGLRMLTCYNFTTHANDGCPISWTGGAYVGPDMQTAINTAYAAGGLNAPILFSMGWPTCWDGINVDTPNHRSHMKFADAGTNKCPETHPYRIAEISLQIFYNINADAAAGRWHLSSDEMEDGATAGSTGHMDYMEGWSPTVAHQFHLTCEDVGTSCSDGDLGNGQAIKDGDKLTQSGGASVPSLDAFRPTTNKVPLGVTGWSKVYAFRRSATRPLGRSATPYSSPQ
jgi:hypothetical protein